MKYRLTRLGVLQTGKVLAALYAFVGLIFCPFLFLVAAIGRQLAPAIMALILIFLYPVMGFVGGVIMAALYNCIARWIGGFEISLEVDEENAPASAAPPE